MNTDKITIIIDDIPPTKLIASKDGFSEKELKKAKKALKKAGIPKPWLIKLTEKETGEMITFELQMAKHSRIKKEPQKTPKNKINSAKEKTRQS